MLIKRHIRYQDWGSVAPNAGGVDLWTRQETIFKVPASIEQPLGNRDLDIFRRTDFEANTESYDSRRVEPLINSSKLFRLEEPVKPGDLITIDIRTEHLLTDLLLDERHSLNVLLWDDDGANVLVYWITVGIEGVLVFSGKLIPDREDFCKKLKANRKDLAFREYMTNLHRADPALRPKPEVSSPLMTLKEVAAYLRVSESTVHRLLAHLALRRTPNKKFIRGEVEAFAARSNPTPKKRR